MRVRALRNAVAGAEKGTQLTSEQKEARGA